jgi:hypothetical protein
MPISILTRLWKEIIIDFVIDLPLSRRFGQTYNTILVIVNRYTKLIQYILTRKTIDAAKLANIFVLYILKGTVMFYLQV